LAATIISAIFGYSEWLSIFTSIFFVLSILY
jgi:hypothetical protein